MVIPCYSLAVRRTRSAVARPKPTVNKIQEIHITSTKPVLLVSKTPNVSARKVTTSDNQNNVHATSQTFSQLLIVSSYLLLPTPYSPTHEYLREHEEEAPAGYPQDLHKIKWTQRYQVEHGRGNRYVGYGERWDNR